jgi:UDP-glucose 4-epimerase
MKVLVTGGAGFIGSHLAEELVRKGFDVSIIDDLSRGKIKNIQKFRDKVSFFREDISNYERVKDFFKGKEVVFHLAALSSVGPCISNPQKCFNSNILGTYNVLKACVKNKIKKIIFASSREVYGDPQYLPIDEEHPLNPKNFYGASKLLGEFLCKSFYRIYRLDYVCLRKSNVYGERDFGRAIPIFIERAKKGEDLVIFGGEQVLDFIYVKDVVNAYIKAMDYKGVGIFNIGTGKGFSIVNIAELIKKVINPNIRIRIKSAKEREVKKYIPKVEKAKRELDFGTKWDLKKFLLSQR